MPAIVFTGSESYPPLHQPALTIGNFDGVHLGHAALLRRLVERAQALGVPSCVYTFEPPPRRVLQPQASPPRILTLADKLELLGAAGVDHVVVEGFNRELSLRPAEWFASEILGARIQPRLLIAGYDFRFGRGRAGDAARLGQLLPKLEIETFGRVELDLDDKRVVVSSSAVRERIAQGEVRLAAQLLGRPFFIGGEVVAGDQRGRSIGFPTANLRHDGELLPADGVYAVRVQLPSGQLWPGVANLGVRPTFGTLAFAVEVHLLDFVGDLYGARLRVHVVERLRGERRFSGVAQLKAQIEQDAQSARLALAP